MMHHEYSWCIILPILQNTQHIAHDAKHAIHFILCKYAIYFVHISLTARGGRHLCRPPLLVYIMCTKYIAYFAKYETYCMFCIMCNMLRILQNGQCNAYFQKYNSSDVPNKLFCSCLNWKVHLVFVFTWQWYTYWPGILMHLWSLILHVLKTQKPRTREKYIYI